MVRFDASEKTFELFGGLPDGPAASLHQRFAQLEASQAIGQCKGLRLRKSMTNQSPVGHQGYADLLRCRHLSLGTERSVADLWLRQTLRHQNFKFTKPISTT